MKYKHKEQVVKFYAIKKRKKLRLKTNIKNIKIKITKP